MLNIFPRTGKRMLIVALCISCCAMTGCIESNFDLARESRLPKWITMPPELTRADVSVTMNYYTARPSGDAKFMLKDKKGRTLATANGRLSREVKGLHRPFCLGHLKYGYPCYEVITVNGITEIIEHKKMEPVFYIVTDDSVLREWLLPVAGINTVATTDQARR